MKNFLDDYQYEAVSKMKIGCILNGGVGSGKSRTALYYYFTKNGGKLDGEYIPMKIPKQLIIITTARKRDTMEWESELLPFLMTSTDHKSIYPKVIVDSWNNIPKYRNLKDCFFIFDEQRVIGKGVWVKSFITISKSNDWILLSATPGDTWNDYIPVFIANGFYRNKTEFEREHCVYSRFTNFPRIDRYIGTGKLLRYRNLILVNMDYQKPTTQHHENIIADYDIHLYKFVLRNRWDPYKNGPIENASELCYLLRRISNETQSKVIKLYEILESTPKVIVFYNFDYELEILRNLVTDHTISEWNGHKHLPIPNTDKWIYLVQYNSGAEGWNCIQTDTIVFYSQNYSYKMMEQASGRIDRRNTPFKDLYYYHLKTKSGIDLAIDKALREKKTFNESIYYRHINDK